MSRQGEIPRNYLVTTLNARTSTELKRAVTAYTAEDAVTRVRLMMGLHEQVMDVGPADEEQPCCQHSACLRRV